MKGLIVKAQDKPEEGYNLVKEGLKVSMFASSVCWHVMGIMYRDDKNHDQSIKAYLNAVRYDPNNIKILTDLASIQMHVRDYKGLLATRSRLLQLRPTMNVYWIGFAVAQHMAGNREMALGTIDTFLQLAELTSKNEISEVLLYKNSIIAEIGNAEFTLKHLQEIEPKSRDPIYVLETRGKCLLQLKKNQEARHVYHQLLKLNSENYEYHACFQQAHGFVKDTFSCPQDQVEGLLKHYDKLLTEFPKSNAIKRIALNFARGEEFRTRVQVFVRNYLSRTIPSLFSALKSLYNDSEKVQIIQDIFTSYEKSIEETGKLPGNENEEAPSTILWTLSYLAYHYDRLGDITLALQYVDKAIDHTPTLLELYMQKARLLKHAGSYSLAAETMDTARKMDLADRYLNTKGTKYLLRADRVKDAHTTSHLFARDQEGNFNIHDMQCMWFENECGESFLRQNKIGQALHSFDLVREHIDEMIEDQFDFHQYSLRKLVLRSYVDMLRFEDRIRSIHFFGRAARGTIRAYLRLFENPSLKEQNKTQEEVDDYEVRKKNTKPKKSEEDKPKKEEDFFGEKLMNAEDPLKEASVYVQHLIEFHGDNLETHLLAAEVYTKRKKHLLALKAVKRARQLAENDPRVHYATVLFFQQYSQDKSSLEANIVEIINSELGFISDAVTFNNEYLNKEKTFGARVAAAQVLFLIGENAKALELILNVEGASLEDASAALEVLQERAPDQVEKLKERLAKIYTLAERLKNK